MKSRIYRVLPELSGPTSALIASLAVTVALFVGVIFVMESTGTNTNAADWLYSDPETSTIEESIRVIDEDPQTTSS